MYFPEEGHLPTKTHFLQKEFNLALLRLVQVKVKQDRNHPEVLGIKEYARNVVRYLQLARLLRICY